MNNFRTMITIAGILIAGIAFNSMGQEPEKIKSTRAHHSYKLEKRQEQDKAHKMKAKPYKDKQHKDKYKLKSDRRTRRLSAGPLKKTNRTIKGLYV